MRINIEDEYLDLIGHVIDKGTSKGDRTGTGTRSVFGVQLRHDLQEGFPLLTTKRVSFHNIAVELLWFISGSTNIRPLVRQGVHIWTDWPLKRYQSTVDPDVSRDQFEQMILNSDLAANMGNLGPVYGKQWRDAIGCVDQLQDAIDTLLYNPDSRRIIVDSWSPCELDSMALTPCHCLFQFNSRPTSSGRKLDIQLYQRSADLGLGVPYNLASYALLNHMIAQVTGHQVGELVWTGGDVHVYENHVEPLMEQLNRERYELPTLTLNRDITRIDDFTLTDMAVAAYNSHPAIRLPVAV